jgi:hypothetical protein
MDEKLYVMYSNYGYIGTATRIRLDGLNHFFINLLGIINAGGRIYKDYDMHYNTILNDDQARDWMDLILPKLIPNYEQEDPRYEYREVDLNGLRAE